MLHKSLECPSASSTQWEQLPCPPTPQNPNQSPLYSLGLPSPPRAFSLHLAGKAFVSHPRGKPKAIDAEDVIFPESKLDFI